MRRPSCGHANFCCVSIPHRRTAYTRPGNCFVPDNNMVACTSPTFYILIPRFYMYRASPMPGVRSAVPAIPEQDTRTRISGFRSLDVHMQFLRCRKSVGIASLFPASFYGAEGISFCNPPSTPPPARQISTPPSPATAKTSPAQLSANIFCPSHIRAFATSRVALRTSQILTTPSYAPLAN